MSKSDLEKLTFELNKIKELNSKLLENNIQPILKEKVQDFLDAFEDYFRERGLVVNAGHLTVRAAFDSLEFTAFSKGDPTIFILKDRETIASISVKYKTPTRSASYQFDTEEEQLKWEIKRKTHYLVIWRILNSTIPVANSEDHIMILWLYLRVYFMCKSTHYRAFTHPYTK